MKITLFTGPNCCLCDDAMAIITEYQSQLIDKKSLNCEKVNIRSKSELYHLYALRIPVVLRQDSQSELGWPFTLEQFKAFVA